MIAAISFIPYLYPPKEIKAQDDASKLKYEEDVITKTAIGAAMEAAGLGSGDAIPRRGRKRELGIVSKSCSKASVFIQNAQKRNFRKEI